MPAFDHEVVGKWRSRSRERSADRGCPLLCLLAVDWLTDDAFVQPEGVAGEGAAAPRCPQSKCQGAWFSSSGRKRDRSAVRVNRASAVQSVGPSLEDGAFHTCAEWSETATDQTLGRTITGGESCMDVDHSNPELRDKLL